MKKIAEKFRGVGVAMITPFTGTQKVDYDALGRLLSHITTGGVDFLVVMGTTAESATLTEEEQQSVLAFIRERNSRNLPILYGIGGNNTVAVIEKIGQTDLTGVDGILSVVPYYNRPNQEGIYQHYAAIAENSPLPIILYNVPGRTGSNMEAATTLRLAHKYPRVILGIKEASGNLNQAAYILKDRPKGFLVISGDDNLTLPLIALGGDGVISVSANAFPLRFSQMVHLALRGDYLEAASLNLELHAVTDMLFKEGNPTGVKSALSTMKIISNALRLPLVPASEKLAEMISKEIEKYNLK